ncbi:protein OS-9 [Tanacetum coccineum]
MLYNATGMVVVVQEFVLGEYDAEATAAHERNFVDTLTGWKNPSRRYHAHIYTNGTKCDVTNETRETEVRFECLEPSEMVIRVAELSTCKYALTIRCEKDIPLEDYLNF